ncbi:lipoprotein-releasing ABC transporter permease subunit [Alteromonas sp. ASW11-130]|uniref:lipoprotein-releasing ABC transporter permease subunit n=1 Tax=Alteromonas sp. ASW11-130 TaxID=3015775 RepID=UPI0022427FAF|nr:lipoprotein-releasing ABC transporter permease subunit [Alteromonas sp. ASW11-130]MCW8090613.1 lipoprotein-releasing ABC transporter permease subunit [Alteromonas sp. ASW11-130]
MLNSLPAFIALRYSTSGKHKSFVAFINRFSVAGIALGVMALIVVVSVMNGFEGQLKDRVLGIAPHIVVKASDASEQSNLSSLPGVIRVMDFIESEGVIQSRSGLRGVQLQGIDPLIMQQHSIVQSKMLVGQFNQLTPGSYHVVIGRALAVQLDLHIGDRLRLLVAGASIYTPFGRMPGQRLVTVSGIYDVGSQLDDKAIFLHARDLQKLLRIAPSAALDRRLFLEDAFEYEHVVKTLDSMQLESENWRSRQGPLFDAVKMEKNMMFMMLLLIIAVAAFNIVSSLVMVVTEKQGDIAILRTQGMARNQIMRIFILNGVFNGMKGALIGGLLGILASTQLNSLLVLMNVPIAFADNGQGIPIDLRWMQIGLVMLFSLLLCVVASLYPAFKAMSVQPASALQNE